MSASLDPNVVEAVAFVLADIANGTAASEANGFKPDATRIRNWQSEVEFRNQFRTRAKRMLLELSAAGVKTTANASQLRSALNTLTIVPAYHAYALANETQA